MIVSIENCFYDEILGTGGKGSPQAEIVLAASKVDEQQSLGGVC